MARRIAILLGGTLLGVSLVVGAFPVGAGPRAAMPTPHMPPTPSGEGQLVDGEGLYQLYCITCHGDELLGLTPEWIAQWPVTHQNCWESKCHIDNHPPDGFVLPRAIPPLAGPGALTRFRTAGDMHAFIQAWMPYQEPGLLTSDEYWAIEAYILKQNGLSAPDPLDDSTASAVLLPGYASSPPPVASPSPPAVGLKPGSSSSPTMDPILAVAAVGVGTVVGVLLFLRRRRLPPGGGG